ncbi:MAG TPA: threonine--tRNA ligase [Gaiellales bacterium]|jgi:threonyl-tRNA synthetase|nr:threonine--tRNA ligase [Gaiellales bacterium]
MSAQRDHRRIGRELRLFMFHEEAPGQAFWLPDGLRLRAALLDWWRREHAARGYREVLTPQVYDAGLWERSGHMAKYREEMFLLPDGDRLLGLKPMNCPGHILVAEQLLRSYRDLPLRLAEIGAVHRHESSGNRNGLLRACVFSIDDAHIFCAPDAIRREIDECLSLAAQVYRTFDLEPQVELSRRPVQRIGDDALWDAAEDALAAALEQHGIDHQVRDGEGAFYGPKIDLHLLDSAGRSWQLGTVQLDFTLGGRFGLAVAGSDGSPIRPVLLHRAMLGSLERFVAILLEHTDGWLPGWLAPTQAVVLAVADRHAGYASDVAAALAAAGARAEAGERSQTLGAGIRDAVRRRVPHVLVVGDRELQERSVSVRRSGGSTSSQPLDHAVRQIVAEVAAP